MDLITIALMLAGAKLFKSKKTADVLEYFPKSVIYSKSQKNFVFYMEILNPTKRDLKIDSFFGSLMINENKVGKVERGNPFTIKANGRTLVSFPIKVVGTGLGIAIAKFLTNPKADITVKIIGVARALGLDNAVSEEVPLEI